jgi:protein SCO1
MHRTFRSVPLRLLPLLALLLSLLWLGASLQAAPAMKLQDYEVGNYPIGGDFTLTNQNGGSSSLKDYRGKAVLLTFGYTHCADICPATLGLLKQVKLGLGKDAAHMQAVFISVDPKRDTPAQLKRFVGGFDRSFAGLTGKAGDLDRLIERYMGKFQIHIERPGDEGHDVDHTAFIYLLDPQGKVRYLFTLDVPRDVIVAGVRTVLARKS